MTGRLDACRVAAGGTIRDAMVALDAGAAQIALATDDEGRLVGISTDGDIRRAILRGVGLDEPLAPALNRSFVSVGPGEGRAEVLELMRARRIDAIPVVDAERRPVGLHLLQAFLEPVERTNWAVVMAGGQGVRLRPLTDSIPKPMLRVAGRPILERIVLHLVGSGITTVFISVNYLGHMIEEHLGDGSRFGCTIAYLREDEPLGTAGALALLPTPPMEPFILMNGDLVTSADLGGLLRAHGEGGYAATIGVRRYLHSIPFGRIDRDGGLVRGIDEKPTIDLEISSGIYALSPTAVERVAPGQPMMVPELIRSLIDSGERVGTFEIEDDWIDVGQREQLTRAREGS